MDQPVTPEAVIWLYKCILGRAPESYEVIDGMVQKNMKLSDARVALFLSEEFEHDQRERSRVYENREY